jgi:hypothetical protein
MAKQPSSEYNELKVFLKAFTVRFMPNNLPPALQPLAMLETMEKTAPARASAGLRMAINDCIEMSSHWPTPKVAALDAELKSQRVLTLSQVRRRYSAAYATLIKRGRIKNDVEYHLVQGILADQALAIDTGERQQLETLAAAYEKAAL